MKSVFIRVYPWLLVTGHLMAAEGITGALQKGLFEEEANHNLEAAIKAYQSVIDQTAEQRKLTATAVFRLGECYRKLGKTNEAIGHYERLIREFPDHAELTKLSQQNLAVLSPGAPRRGQPPAMGTSSAPPEDPETKEINRLKALAKDSPDLLNQKNSSGDTPLHDAAGRGYLKVAEFLLVNKAQVNAANNRGTTPLHYAVHWERKPMVEFLLANGAEVNASGDIEQSGELSRCQPLHLAVHKGNQTIVELLLNHKADANGIGYYGRTPLHYAANKGFLGLVRLLLSKGADLNLADGRGWTPAALAAIEGHEHILRLLLESGVDVSAHDNEGSTLAHYTTLQRSPGMLKAVLDRKPDLEIQNKSKRTPLLLAVLAGGPQAVESFLKAGANPNARSEDGAFPLMAAVDRSNKEAVRLLLAHKADPNLTDLEGITALNRAIVRSLESNIASAEKKILHEIADLLRQAGASDVIARTPFIGIARGKDKVVNPQFIRQDSKGLNRVTLFELLVYIYNGRGPTESSSVNETGLKFPDFTKIRIDRLVNGSKERKTIGLDLERALLSGDCTADVPLEWGDIVEIPEGDHKVNAPWNGLPEEIRETLTKCLERQVMIGHWDETATLKIGPAFWTSGGAARRGPGPLQPAGTNDGRVPYLRLKTVLYNSGLLRSSDDLKRVEVSRKLGDGKKLNLTFNVEGPSGPDDLILRDGDHIRVPRVKQ